MMFCVMFIYHLLFFCVCCIVCIDRAINIIINGGWMEKNW